MLEMAKHKIVELKDQVRNPSRKTIVLDNGSVFGISEDVLLSKNIAVGDEISTEELNDIIDKEDLSKAMNSAFTLLEYRMRSINELKDRLYQKGFARNKIDTVIEKLINMEYLDDKKFAYAFAKDKVKSRKIGPAMLRQELIKHRLDNELIQETISRIYDEFPSGEMIGILIEKKLQRLKKVTVEDINKLQNYLARKGFNWDDINTKLSSLKAKL